MHCLSKSAIVVFLLLSHSVLAGPLDVMERAIMPGKLSNAHVKYEDDCDKCHKSFDKTAQTDLCADCHKEIHKDMQDNRGFHGRSKDVERKPCRNCHTEHKGRKAGIVLLDRETFDHGITDFELRDSHVGVKCQSCHKPPKDKKKPFKYRDAPSECYKCHREDEPHRGRLGDVCVVCHRESKWKDFYFDHKKTEFPLAGKHRGVQCDDCHPNERYKEIPKNCFACHRLDNRHKGRYARKCDKCHAPTGWSGILFDHDKDTKYKLENSHKGVTCNQCHKGKNIYEENLTDACFQCHKADDVHRGRNGKKCENCHNTKGFGKAKFDHDKTDFPLQGKHKDVNCTDCHRGNLKDELSTGCYDCHQPDDVHKGQQGKNCVQCHDERGWNAEVVFDHALSKFPLLGVHATLACEQCHVSRSFKDAEERCISCHKEDDTHKKTLGPKCELCHNASDWKAWLFDHDKQTDFKLEGAHKGLVCNACHREKVKKEIRMDADCYSCHAGDDAHAGSFGRYCDRCHTTKRFDKLKDEFKP